MLISTQLFIRIDIVLFKYNALYFTYPPPKHDFSHILPSCSRFTAESQQFHPKVVLLHNNPWLRNISTTAAQCILFPLLFAPIISQNCRHYKASWLLCSINAISSSSCVFKLQNPIVLHCLISPLKNWDDWSFFYGVKNPRIIQPFTSLTTI